MKSGIKIDDIFSLFTSLITNIQRYINKIKDKNMKSIGLKSCYLSCLYYLYKFGPMSQMRLCEVCDENKSAICRKIEYLTQHDYVQKDTSADTKYKKPISLTIKGKKIAQYISAKVNEIIEKANADFSDTERAVLYSGLEKVNQKLKKITTSE